MLKFDLASWNSGSFSSMCGEECGSGQSGLFAGSTIDGELGDSLPILRLNPDENDHFLFIPLGLSGGDSSGTAASSCSGT